MKHDTYHEETGLSGYFPGREKQDVFPAAPMDGWTAARENTRSIQPSEHKDLIVHE
jgi:hypothetical protein